MKKTVLILLLALVSSGCATYKFKHGQAPYDKGYVVSRDSYTIPEYTLGRDNSVPQDLSLANERFHKRRGKVEYYYKKMGYIENRFKRAVYDPMVMFAKLVTGVFRLPFIALSDYKYDHNPAYREKVKKIEEEKDLKEETRVASLKEKLKAYIEKSLDSEKPFVPVVSPAAETGSASKAESVEKELAHLETMSAQAAASDAEAAAVSSAEMAKELDAAETPQEVKKPLPRQKTAKPKPEKKKPVVAKGEPQAVITAKPRKGFSPLTVHFSGSASKCPRGRITSYHWDFGDGDTSTLPRTRNTYYSGLSEPQVFTATLTVTDDQGNTSSSSVDIEVLNK